MRSGPTKRYTAVLGYGYLCNYFLHFVEVSSILVILMNISVDHFVKDNRHNSYDCWEESA